MIRDIIQFNYIRLKPQVPEVESISFSSRVQLNIRSSMVEVRGKCPQTGMRVWVLLHRVSPLKVLSDEKGKLVMKNPTS